MENNVPATTPIRVYFGTYTSGEGKGIYVAELDRESGKLSEPRLAGEAVNPSFLAIHPSQKFLYAVGEVSDFEGKKSGGVSAFVVDPKSGALKLINQMSSGGAGPCHLTVDATGKDVLVANYGGGSVACLPINDDGSLRAASTFIQHEGSSVDKQRQAGPHAHSINIDAANRYAVAADLGLDKLMVYRFDPVKGTLTPNDPPSLSLPAGGGPRHFAFHPDGVHAYACNEMLSTVSALSYDPKQGVLTELQTISTLPAGGHPGNSTAEVRVHPSGKFVYVSNRGHDSIAMFAVDAKTGKLTPLGQESTRWRSMEICLASCGCDYGHALELTKSPAMPSCMSKISRTSSRPILAYRFLSPTAPSWLPCTKLASSSTPKSGAISFSPPRLMKPTR